MRRSSSIASRIREVFLDGHWVANTNYKEQLSGLPWDKAVQNFQGLNSVAALTYHINYYLAGLIVVFKGGGLEIHDKYSFDLPEINSENKWQTLVAELLSNAEEFAQHVDVMTDELLDSSFVDEKYGSYARNIEAVIEHSYYHLGQITLIRKLLKR